MLTVPVLVALVLWIVLARLTRLVGVSSCAAALSLPATVGIGALADDRATIALATPFLVVTGAVAMVVVWRHRGNLRRTLAGTEPRIGQPLSEDR